MSRCAEMGQALPCLIASNIESSEPAEDSQCQYREDGLATLAAIPD
jgi:hypothetical protein